MIECVLKCVCGENGGNGRCVNVFEVMLDVVGLVWLGMVRETREGGDATTFGVVERDDDGVWRWLLMMCVVVCDEDLGVVCEFV